MDKKHDLPAMPFYVGDWLKCPEVRSLPPDYRGLWFDLICFMWESTERGVMVKPNGKPYTDQEITRMVGLDNQNTSRWLSALLENNVCGRREDGAIFSRRMVKEEKIRAIRRDNGLKGGNPNLVKYTHNQGVKLFTENENENVNENEDKNKDENANKDESKKVPKSIDQAKEYFLEIGIPQEAESFWDHFSSNGWRVGGKAPMKDWKSAARNWKRNMKNRVVGTKKIWRGKEDMLASAEKIMEDLRA